MSLPNWTIKLSHLQNAPHHTVVLGTSRHVLCVQYILCYTNISHQTFSFNLLLFIYDCVSAWLCWISCFLYIVFINVREREHWRGNHKWTIRRNWQHWVHKTQNEDNQNKKTAAELREESIKKKHKLNQSIQYLILFN